jgi:hypothetical protein
MTFELQISKLRQCFSKQPVRTEGVDNTTPNTSLYIEHTPQYMKKEIEMAMEGMLQSSMFTNSDGYTAMNDLGLVQSDDGPAPMNDDGHVGGWDSMFQEPLQPFSF